jgi:hypothetical protein
MAELSQDYAGPLGHERQKGHRKEEAERRHVRDERPPGFSEQVL